MRSTRRDLVKWMGAASLLGAAPLNARADSHRSTPQKTDAIIVGAGLAGLNAALLLEDEGLRVRVLEASDKVGGRVLSFTDLPGNPEAGANSFYPGYARIIALCERLGVGTFKYSDYRIKNSMALDIAGEFISIEEWAKSKHNPAPEALRTLPPYAVAANVITNNNPLQSPYEWQELTDSVASGTTHEFLSHHGLSETAIRLFHDTNPPNGTSAHEVSALMWLFIDAWFKSKLAMGTDELVVKGGNIGLPVAMANALQEPVELESEVAQVEQHDKHVAVTLTDGREFEASNVVLALPLPPLRRIRFTPQLPDRIHHALMTVPQMAITQVHIIPDEPYWEEDGMAPGIWSDGPMGQLVPIYEGTEPGAISSLTLWGRGFGAHYLDSLGAEKASQFAIEEIEKRRPAAIGKVRPAAFKSWQLDPYAGGDWVIWKQGQMHKYMAGLAQPFDRIHFAGEHTSLYERGMEAAAESGERAAVEILV